MLPNRTGVISVSISCDDERETITDKREIDSLFANLSTVRIKSGESYNDAPMTDKFIKIIFEVSDGLSGCTVYVFEDENGFFIEQPYNGIFSIEEKQFICPKPLISNKKSGFVCRGATITHAYLQEMRLLGLPAYAMISIGP